MKNLDPGKIKPTEYRVLVRLDPVEEKTAGGVILAKDTRDRKQMAQIVGELIAVGGNAFEGWHDPIPQIGDRVLIAKYSGDRPPLDETETYAVCNDKDVVAVIS